MLSAKKDIQTCFHVSTNFCLSMEIQIKYSKIKHFIVFFSTVVNRIMKMDREINISFFFWKLFQLLKEIVLEKTSNCLFQSTTGQLICKFFLRNWHHFKDHLQTWSRLWAPTLKKINFSWSVPITSPGACYLNYIMETLKTVNSQRRI